MKWCGVPKGIRTPVIALKGLVLRAMRTLDQFA